MALFLIYATLSLVGKLNGLHDQILKQKKTPIYIGDFNGHEQEWLGSKSKTNAMGTAVKDFCEAHSFENLVKLPTRGDNVLDLVLSSKGGEVS